jgi:hypothetical protein
MNENIEAIQTDARVALAKVFALALIIVAQGVLIGMLFEYCGCSSVGTAGVLQAGLPF